jgi:hypothetical protein
MHAIEVISPKVAHMFGVLAIALSSLIVVSALAPSATAQNDASVSAMTARNREAPPQDFCRLTLLFAAFCFSIKPRSRSGLT